MSMMKKYMLASIEKEMLAQNSTLLVWKKIRNATKCKEYLEFFFKKTESSFGRAA
jgi:hypothetical protein